MHHPPPRTVKGHPERSRQESRRRNGRSAERRIPPVLGSGRWCDRDGDQRGLGGQGQNDRGSGSVALSGGGRRDGGHSEDIGSERWR